MDCDGFTLVGIRPNLGIVLFPKSALVVANLLFGIVIKIGERGEVVSEVIGWIVRDSRPGENLAKFRIGGDTAECNQSCHPVQRYAATGSSRKCAASSTPEACGNVNQPVTNGMVRRLWPRQV